MKTILAVLAAGFLGAGAALGAVALGLVPLNNRVQSAQVAPVAIDGPESTATDHSASEEIAGLRKDLAKLSVDIEQSKSAKPTDHSAEIASLKAEIAALKTSKPASAPVAAPEDGPAAGSSDFDTAVRGVVTRLEEERREERRLERQADRAKELEDQKVQISEYIPRFVEGQAARLNIPQGSIAEVSNALVTHLQFRAELRSERDGQRIDGVEVDDKAYEQKMTDLDATTSAALSTYVDAETAKNILNAVNRTGGRNTPQAGQARPGRGNR